MRIESFLLLLFGFLVKKAKEKKKNDLIDLQRAYM